MGLENIQEDLHCSLCGKAWGTPLLASDPLNKNDLKIKA